MRIGEVSNIEMHIVERCDELVSSHNAKELTEGIIGFLEPQQYPPHYFYNFLNRIIAQYPDISKELYNELLAKSERLFYMYGGDMLYGARHIFRDTNFYWDQVRVLQKLDKWEADNLLLNVYGRRVPGTSVISESDTDVILKIFNKNRNENNYSLASGIQSLMVAQHPNVLHVCQLFLKRVQQKEAEMFFIWLGDNKVASDELIADLVLNHTVRFYLSYEIERCLNKVLIQRGINPIFEYLINRFEYKRKIVNKEKTLLSYDFVPHGQHSHLFDDTSADNKIEMFLKALDWYLRLDDVDGIHLYYAKNLLEYLQPEQSIGNTLYQHYGKLIEQRAESGIGIDRLMDSLSIFEIKDDNLLALVIDGFIVGYDIQETNEKLYKSIRQECFFAITSQGVKTGTPGQPFQVDIDLQNLLTVKINSMQEHYPGYQFIEQVLNSVNDNINRLLDKDNFTW